MESTSLNLRRNYLKEKKCYILASSTLKIKCGRSNGMQEKYLSWVYGVEREKSVTQDHCSTTVGKPMMPTSDPHGIFYYPRHTPMKDTKI